MKHRKSSGPALARASRTRSVPLTGSQICLGIVLGVPDTRWDGFGLEYALMAFREAWDAPVERLRGLHLELFALAYGYDRDEAIKMADPESSLFRATLLFHAECMIKAELEEQRCLDGRLTRLRAAMDAKSPPRTLRAEVESAWSQLQESA